MVNGPRGKSTEAEMMTGMRSTNDWTYINGKNDGSPDI